MAYLMPLAVGAHQCGDCILYRGVWHCTMNCSSAHLQSLTSTENDMIESQSDDRTANNAVRHQYRVLTDDEKRQMVELKDIAASFIAKCDEVGQSRELSLAKTNAEQAAMWAVKHVTA